MLLKKRMEMQLRSTIDKKCTPIIEEYPPLIIFKRIRSKITYESCPWAKDKAQSLRYEAVLETVPKTYSIV